LRDFIVGNELSIVDFMFYQKTSYTYFNIFRNLRTQIDHVFSTNYDVCDINICDIVSLDDSNLNNHLPIRILITLSVQQYNNSILTENGHSDSLFTNWYKKLNNYEYCRIFEDKLSNIPVLSVESICDKVTLQTQVDNYVDTLKFIFVEAAKLAKVIPKNILKPTKYWCPDLSQSRDMKTFWWRRYGLIMVDQGKEKYINVIKM